MVTFVCERCGQERTAQRRRCYQCTVADRPPEVRERIRKSLAGRPHSPERIANIRKARHAQVLAGIVPPNPARFAPGQQAHNEVPVGHRRRSNGHWQIKCADGKFRYEHRVVWEQAHGPIPEGMVIHHINHDPYDNRLDNLQLLTNGEHTRHHADSERSRAAQLLGVEARKARGGHY